MTHHTVEISKEQGKKLRILLEERDFAFAEAPYAHFRASGSDVNLTYYESGKLVVQGKGLHEFMEFFLEPEILHNVNYTAKKELVDTTARIGCDESGKGDFFGPLVACAFFAAGEKVKELIDIGVCDSKKLSDAKVLEMSKKLRLYSHELVCLLPATYNDLYARFGNLNELLAWAHTKAIEALRQKIECNYVFIDQFAYEGVMQRRLKKLDPSILLRQETKAESDVVVAAASICARARFLEEMDKMREKFSTPFAKGASALVKKVGKDFVSSSGKEALKDVAKLHFKTAQEILDLCPENP